VARPKATASPKAAAKRKAAAKPKAAASARTAPARTARPSRGRSLAGTLPRIKSYDEFMAYAWAMEDEASERYANFADQMEVHNNTAVADLFRKLSRIEEKHRDQILGQMGWTTPPVGVTYSWIGYEGPETGDLSDIHYLMQPYHALKLAELNERRAAAFFGQIAKLRVPADVRAAAKEMEEEEHEHVRLVQAWLAKVPEPDADWDEDLDPPTLPD
jgi:rubrerythrin